jgi:hypothetical protein
MVYPSLRPAFVAAATLDATSGNWTTSESAADLLTDRIDLMAATTVLGVAYGIMISLYFTTMYFLMKRVFQNNSRCSSNPDIVPTSRNEWRKTFFYVAYTSVLFVLATLYTAGNSQNAVIAYVDNRLFPGGPSQYYMEYMTGQMAMVMTDIVSLVIFWLTDALILWRFIVFYHKLPYARWIIPLPCAMYVSVLVLSTLVLQGEAGLGKIFYLSTNLLLAYYSLSLSLNVLTTVLIAARLYIHNKQLERVFGPRAGSPYMNLATILVESAALYGVWSFVFLMLCIKGSPGQIIFLGTMTQIQVIAPLLIILWIARGRAWGSHSRATTPDLPPPGGMSRLSFGSRPVRAVDEFEFVDSTRSRSGSRSVAAGGDPLRASAVELGLCASVPSSITDVEGCKEFAKEEV